MSLEFAKKVIEFLSDNERQNLISELLQTKKAKPVKKVVLTDDQAKEIILRTFRKQKNRLLQQSV